MNYYFYKNVKDGVIEKYKVDFNKEDLINLRKKVIDNCSEIMHCSYV